MAWVEIDLEDLGAYQGEHQDGYDLRYSHGDLGNYTVTKTSEYIFSVRYGFGSTYSVNIIQYHGRLYAECTCYDFEQYGRRYGRACHHIWRVYLHESFVVV